MDFTSIYCQDKAVDILQRAYKADRVAGAYIFAGADGVGKDTTARVFARLLLCQKPAKDDESGFFQPCSSCPSCLAFDSDAKSDSHTDFSLIYKELLEYTDQGKGKTAPIDLPIAVIREFLIDKVAVRPALSSRRVFIVLEAERLNRSSQNALLKVLEEPPAFCTIILICSSVDALLPTTRSRCQIVPFGPIEQKVIEQKLLETGLEQEKSRFFASLSQHSMGVALSLAKLQQHVDLYQIKTRIVDDLAQLRFEQALKVSERLTAHSKALAEAYTNIMDQTSKSALARQADKTVIKIIISALSDAMKTALAMQADITNSDQKTDVQAIAQRLGPEKAARNIELCDQAGRWIDASVNQKLIFDQLLLNLSEFGKM